MTAGEIAEKSGRTDPRRRLRVGPFDFKTGTLVTPSSYFKPHLPPLSFSLE